MLLVLILVLVALLAIKIVKISFFWKKHGIPYESFSRYIYRMVWLSTRQTVHDTIIKNSNRYGPVFGTYRGLTPTLVVSDMEIAKDVLAKQFTNFFKRSFEFTSGDPLWDKSINHLPYEEWKNLRAIMGHTFTSAKMRGIIPKLDSVAKRLVKRFDDSAIDDSKNVLTFTEYFKSYSVDSTTAVSFGLDLNCIDNPDSKFVKFASNIISFNLSTMLFFMFPRIMRYVPFFHFPPKETIQFFSEVTKQVLKEKRQNLDEAIKNGTTDIMDLHLIAQREDSTGKLTDDILASQAFTFLVAGVDTMSVTLELTTYHLTVIPEAQANVLEEIKASLGDRMDVQFEDVQNMKYLEACIYESLRISQMGAIIDRVCSTPTTVAGIPIDKGMIVEVNAAHIQHNSKYFSEPEMFMPERFLKDEGSIQRELAGFLMFGDGPKNCVGKRFAIMNLIVLLANLILRFKLERCDSTPPFPLKSKPGIGFTNFSEKPINVRIVPRPEL